MSETEDQRIFKGMTPEQIDALLSRPGPAEAEENRRRLRKASSLVGLPIEEWPKFEALWDLSDAGQRFAFDGMTKAEFDKHYPIGLSIYFVEVVELDSKLCAFNRRTPAEVWGVGIDAKAAGVMLDWIEGRAVTPPAVTRTKCTDEICLLGGNHRLAVARSMGEISIPILVDPDHFEFIADSLAIYSKWPRH